MLAARSNSHIARKGPLKVIAFITLWSFLFSISPHELIMNKARAAGTPLELPSSGSNRPGSPSASLKELDVDTFGISCLLGELEDTWKGDSGKTVIHIQDAHCNYSCQKSIRSIVDYLTSEYGIDLALLEGGAGNYDLSVFTDIEDKPLREKVADYFVKEGRVNGAEFFAINNPDRITLKGLEEPGLYIKNLKAYRESLAHKGEVDKILNVLKHYLTNLKRYVYSEELKEFEEKRKVYSDEKTDLSKYLTDLAELSKRLAIDISKNENLHDLIKTIEQEKDIDFKRANSERDRLIKELTKRLSILELETLAKKSFQFKEDSIKQTEFYSYLFRKAKTIALNIETSYPNLSGYKRYIDTYDSIDNRILFNEIETLEDDVVRKLFKNTTQEKLYALSKNLSLLKDLFNISLTTNRYKRYQENKHSLGVSHFLSFINTETPKFNIKANISDEVKALDKYRESIEKFYELAFKRDNAFIKNIASYSKNRDNLIVVSGGFHAENLQNLLKDNGYSYISILPKFINGNDYECPYFSLLAGKESKLDILIKKSLSYTAQNSSIAINSLFDQMDIVDIREQDGTSIKVELLQAILDDKLFTARTVGGWDIVFTKKNIPEKPATAEVYKSDIGDFSLTAAIYDQPVSQTPDIQLVSVVRGDTRSYFGRNKYFTDTTLEDIFENNKTAQFRFMRGRSAEGERGSLPLPRGSHKHVMQAINKLHGDDTAYYSGLKNNDLGIAVIQGLDWDGHYGVSRNRLYLPLELLTLAHELISMGGKLVSQENLLPSLEYLSDILPRAPAEINGKPLSLYTAEELGELILTDFIDHEYSELGGETHEVCVNKRKGVHYFTEMISGSVSKNRGDILSSDHGIYAATNTIAQAARPAIRDEGKEIHTIILVGDAELFEESMANRHMARQAENNLSTAIRKAFGRERRNNVHICYSYAEAVEIVDGIKDADWTNTFLYIDPRIKDDDFEKNIEKFIRIELNAQKDGAILPARPVYGYTAYSQVYAGLIDQIRTLRSGDTPLTAEAIQGDDDIIKLTESAAMIMKEMMDGDAEIAEISLSIAALIPGLIKIMDGIMGGEDIATLVNVFLTNYGEQHQWRLPYIKVKNWEEMREILNLQRKALAAI